LAELQHLPGPRPQWAAGLPPAPSQAAALPRTGPPAGRPTLAPGHARPHASARSLGSSYLALLASVSAGARTPSTRGRSYGPGPFTASFGSFVPFPHSFTGSVWRFVRWLREKLMSFVRAGSFVRSCTALCCAAGWVVPANEMD
jgi:hypothetical protein